MTMVLMLKMTRMQAMAMMIQVVSAGVDNDDTCL